MKSFCTTIAGTMITTILLLGLTANAQVTGSGTSGHLSKWTGTTTLGNSVAIEHLGNIGIGTPNPGAKLQVVTGANGFGIITITGGAQGVSSQVNGNGRSLVGINIGSVQTLELQNNLPLGSNGFLIAAFAHGANKFSVDTNGNLFAAGSKSAVVPLDDGRSVALYAVESTENWFEDFGSAKLISGTSTIAIDSTFAKTINSDSKYQVFITPKGNCKGLYLASEDPQKIPRDQRENIRGFNNQTGTWPACIAPPRSFKENTR